jgi:hypothetical protein
MTDEPQDMAVLQRVFPLVVDGRVVETSARKWTGWWEGLRSHAERYTYRDTYMRYFTRPSTPGVGTLSAGL